MSQCALWPAPDACDEQSSSAVGSSGPRWYTLYTRSRQEKALAQRLQAAGIRFFLPLLRRETTYAHRRRETLAPMFPSYVFLHGDATHLHNALDSRRVVHVIHVADQRRLHHELTQIHDAIGRGADLDVCSYLDTGVRVRITGGPFQGLEGIVDECRSHHRVVLTVGMVSGAVCLEVGADLLERID